eukprot:SAG25_NODE_459_length_7828_cov_24.263907_11_plen_57_part_00
MSGYMLSAYLLANRLIKETPIQPFHLLPEVICDGVKFTDVVTLIRRQWIGALRPLV